MNASNVQFARRLNYVFVTGDTSVLDEIVAEDVIDHNARPGQRSGRLALVDAVVLYRSAFPDIEITADQTVTDGDLVAITGTISGTNTGELMGLPATGKRAVFAYMDMHRIVDGRIVESWHVEDLAGMLTQLGHMPG